MPSKAALIIFIKNPVPGRVKTRLARSIGANQALEIYKELCDYTRSVCIEYEGPKYLYYSDDIVDQDSWDPAIFQKRKQSEGELGTRMVTAFKEVFMESPRAILIGSDCPYVLVQHLNEADNNLHEVNCVIGPARDGGYYLLGLNKMNNELFENKNWSTSTVLEETIQTLNQSGFSYSFLEVLNDIDELEDWKNYKNSSAI